MRSIALFSLLLVCLGSLGCESANYVDADAVIAEKVEERLTEFKRIIDQRCQDRILDAAGKIADSIIMERARLYKDTLDRPLKPLRPDKPELLALPDSLPLAPLFRKDSLE